MASKGALIHKQQFQNAQQVIEVTIKPKPKAKLGLKTKPKSNSKAFVRDCLLKKELPRLTKEIENKKLKIKSDKMNPVRPMPKLKINQPKMVIEVYKESRRKKDRTGHDILPPGVTWGEFLNNISSQSSDSQLPNACSIENNISKDNLYRNTNNYPKESKIYEVENQVPEKLITGTNKPVSKKDQSKFQDHAKGEHRLQEKIADSKNFENNIRQIIHREAPVLLPRNSCKPLQINKSIQTSTLSNIDLPTPDQPNFKKSSKPLPIKSQIDQTHSPFSESALKLLRQLRDRLHSKGDSEGSEIVNAIEAYFGSAEGKSNQGELDIGDSASPVFPPVFSQKEFSALPSDYKNERLTRIILQQDKKLEEQDNIIKGQDKKISEQDETIQELKSLLARLLAYHEQLAKQIVQCSKNIPTNLNPGHSKAERQNEDSGLNLSAAEDLQKALKHLTSERDAMIKENRMQRDVILHLEVKLSHCELENKRIKKNTHHIAENQQVANQKEVFSFDKEMNVVRDKVQTEFLRRTPPNDNEADSAFEDKSYKSSRPTSKASTAISNRSSVPVQDKKVSYETISSNDKNSDPIQNHQISIPSSVVNRPILSELDAFVNNNSNRVSAFERLQIMKTGSFPSTCNNSFQPVSDASSEHSTIVLNYEEDNFDYYGTMNCKENLFSETPLYTTPDNYFESTHLDKRKTNSSSKPSVPKERFKPQLSYLHSETSGDETKLISLNIESE